MNNIESIDRKFLKLKFIEIVVVKIKHTLSYVQFYIPSSFIPFLSFRISR